MSVVSEPVLIWIPECWCEIYNRTDAILLPTSRNDRGGKDIPAIVVLMESAHKCSEDPPPFP